MDENLADLADLSLNGDRLTLDFDDNFDAVVTPTAVLTLPSLTALDLDGASDVFVDGEAIELIDAGGASTVLVSAAAVRGSAGGASTISVGPGTDLDVSTGGASSIETRNE